MHRYCQMIGLKLFKSSARRLLSNNIFFYSRKMDQAIKYNIKTTIDLTKEEEELFKLFTDFVKEKEVKTVIRVAGGWVRDKVIGRENHDIDFALENMMGEDFIKLAHEYFKEKTHVRGFGVTKFNPEKSKHLETATIEIMGKWIDVVNLRGEAYEGDSRVPKITMGTPEEDAYRRDLTLNALFYNLETQKIEDFTQRGLEDLKYGIARTPLEPEKTYTDDPLRILRTIRFTSRFDLTIDEGIENSLKKPEILEGLIKKVSKERIGTELRQMLSHSSAVNSITLFDKYNLLPYMIEIPNNCKELYTKVELRDAAFKRGVTLCQELASQLLKEGKYLFTETLCSTNEFSESRMLLNLTLLLGPFYQYNCEIKPKKFENLLSLLIREGVKMTNREADIATACLGAAAVFQKVSKDFLNRNARLIDIAKTIKDMKGWANFWEIGFIYAGLSDMLDTMETEKGSVFELYTKFYRFIYENNLHNCYELKTLVDGKQISELFGVKGPQIQFVKDNVFYWQIDNPTKTLEQLKEEISNNKDKFFEDRFK